MIVIHFGLLRSGSASIQSFLAANEHALRRLSVDYPRIGRLDTPDHSNLGGELIGRESFSPELGTLSQLADHWRATPYERMIISSDSFEELDVDEVEHLKETLASVGRPFRIVITLGDLVGALTAIYAQSFRSAQKGFDFDLFFERQMAKHSIDYFATVRRWGQVFGWKNLRACSHEEGSANNLDSIGDFLDAVALDSSEPRLLALPRPDPIAVVSGWKILEATRALYKVRHGLERDHPLMTVLARADREFDDDSIERAMIVAGDRRGWMADKGRYLTIAQARRCFTIEATAISALNEHLVVKLPSPIDLGERGFVERDFLPDVSRIPEDELRGLYDDVGERLVKRSDRAEAAYGFWRQDPIANSGGGQSGDLGGNSNSSRSDFITPDPAIVIHIGLKKSGSASIQTFLSANEDELRRLDVDYTRVGRLERKAHNNLSSQLQGRKNFDPQMGGFSELVDYALAAPFGMTVLSSEMFEGCGTDAVVRIKELLAPLNRPFRIILVIRDLVDLLPSSYLQKIRNGGHTFDFDAFFIDRIADARVEYFETATKWAGVFGWENLRVRPLDPRQLVNGELIDDFLTAAGLDANHPLVRAMRRPGVVNSTKGWKTFEAIRALHKNRHGLPPNHPLPVLLARSDSKIHRRRVQEVAVDVGEQRGWAQDQARFLTRTQAQISLDTYADNIVALNRHLAEELLPPADLDSRGFVERDFLPDATQIPPDELRAFYDELGERLNQLRRADTDAKKVWRPAPPANRP